MTDEEKTEEVSEAPRPRPKKQCARKRSSGWGAMQYCLFDMGHSGPCSWVVTG